MCMKSNTIKTLAEYISKLRRDNSDFFSEYKTNQFDTNGVEQDHADGVWSHDISSRADK